MTKQILKDAVADLLALPPVLHRTMRQKIFKATFGDADRITSLHGEIIRLLEEEGPLSMGQIGEMLMIAKAQMTQLTDKLVELNIVERRGVEGDRRKIEIAFTNDGRQYLKEHKKNIDNTLAEAMSLLDDKELESLSMALTTVSDLLSKLK
jgi:DNA-binding MarR family transcriptional regulator